MPKMHQNSLCATPDPEPHWGRTSKERDDIERKGESEERWGRPTYKRREGRVGGLLLLLRGGGGKGGEGIKMEGKEFPRK